VLSLGRATFRRSSVRTRDRNARDRVREDRRRGSRLEGSGELRRREEQRRLLPPHVDEAAARLPHQRGDGVWWLIAGRGDDDDLSGAERLGVSAPDVLRKSTVDHLLESDDGAVAFLSVASGPV